MATIEHKHLRPIDMEIMVVGVDNNKWGQGETFEEAHLRAKRPKQYLVYVCAPGTQMNEDASMSWVSGLMPKLIMRKVRGKR